MRSQKRQKKRKRGSSTKEEEKDEDDDDDDDVKVDKWQGRYFTKASLDTIIIDISCLHHILQILQFLILH